MQNRIARLRKKLSEEKRFVSIDQARIITRSKIPYHYCLQTFGKQII
jgi:hypothetical protein